MVNTTFETSSPSIPFPFQARPCSGKQARPRPRTPRAGEGSQRMRTVSTTGPSASLNYNKRLFPSITYRPLDKSSHPAFCDNFGASSHCKILAKHYNTSWRGLFAFAVKISSIPLDTIAIKGTQTTTRLRDHHPWVIHILESLKNRKADSGREN